MKIVKHEPMEYCMKCVKECDDEGSCRHKKLTRKHVLVLPGCCEASKEACCPRVAVQIDWDNPEAPGTGRWYIPFGSDEEVRYAFRDPRDYKPTPPVTHCPFCGTKLPEIVLDPAPPRPIASHDDCGHCGCGWPRSYGMCACWPRVSVYDVKAP